MKKNLLFTFFLSAILMCKLSLSQTVFYTENFTTGGVGWNLNVNTGTEGATPNFFTVSDNEGGVLPPGCGVALNGNKTLHVTSVLMPSSGASYDAGGLCGFGFCPQTNRKAESPTINCTARTTVSVNFNYIENGDGTNDDASIWYYDGLTWALLNNMPKTVICGGGQGQWTSKTVALPASANNNPSVKIAFRWINNDDGIGTDPSFAVDNITLSVPSGITFTVTLPSPVCQSTTLNATYSSTSTPTTFTWSASSGSVAISAVNSGTTTVSFSSPGTYTISLAACQGTNCSTASTSITVNALPTILTSTSKTLICKGESVNLTASGATSYTWNTSATTTIIVVSPTVTTTYTVSGTGLNGCTNSTTITQNVSQCTSIQDLPNDSFSVIIYPNPASDLLNIDLRNSNIDKGILQIINTLGKVVVSEAFNSNNLKININNLTAGIYFVKITSENKQVVKRISIQ